MITSLNKPPEDISLSESEAEIEAAAEVKSPLPLQERLDRAIIDEINAEITSKTRKLNDITSVVKKELINFEIEGNDLNTILPTSVESERGFSH
jgi:hypothetical protein